MVLLLTSTTLGYNRVHRSLRVFLTQSRESGLGMVKALC